MNKSVASRASNASSKMLEEIANRSQTKYHYHNNLEFIKFRELLMISKWESYGIHLASMLAEILGWEEESIFPN